MKLFDLLISPRGQALDRHLVRYTGHSLINRAFAHKLGFECQPALLLRSRGRHSGLWRDAVLPWFYHGTERVVVGSAGGSPADPGWVHNLREHPQAEVFVDRELQDVSARFLEGEEYQRVWAQLTSVVPQYAEYQRACGDKRQIPLVALQVGAG